MVIKAAVMHHPLQCIQYLSLWTEMVLHGPLSPASSPAKELCGGQTQWMGVVSRWDKQTHTHKISMGRFEGQQVTIERPGHQCIELTKLCIWFEMSSWRHQLQYMYMTPVCSFVCMLCVCVCVCVCAEVFYLIKYLKRPFEH